MTARDPADTAAAPSRSAPSDPAAQTAVGAGGPGERAGRDQRREQLLAIGDRLFATRGYDEVPIDEIAEAAGISRGLLYHYFPSKQAFHLAVVDRALVEVRELLTPDPALPPWQALSEALHRFYDYVADRRPGALPLTQGTVGSGTELQERVEAFREGTVEQVLGALRERGVAAPEEAELRMAVRGWTGAVEGLAVGWLRHGDPDRREVELPRLVELATSLLERWLIDLAVRAEPVDPS